MLHFAVRNPSQLPTLSVMCLLPRVKEDVRTSGKKAVFGEDGDRIDEENGRCTGSARERKIGIGKELPWNSPPKLKKSVAMLLCVPHIHPRRRCDQLQVVESVFEMWPVAA